MSKSTYHQTIVSAYPLNLQWRAIALSVTPFACFMVALEPSFAQTVDPLTPAPLNPVLETPVPIVSSTPIPGAEEVPTPIVLPTPDPVLPLAPQPVSLTILNPSFEQDIVGGDSAVDFITGWQILSSAPWSVGVYSPGSGSYAAQVPDGVNVAYANSGSLFQRLTDSLIANTQYTLGISVGSRPPYGFPGYQVDLLAGETVIATANAPVPEFGQFIYSELTYTATETDLLLGQPLAVRLSSSGIQVNFDNVRLTSLLLTPPTPPVVIPGGEVVIGTVPTVDPLTGGTTPIVVDGVTDPAIASTTITPFASVDSIEGAVTSFALAQRSFAPTDGVRELAAIAEVDSPARAIESVPEPTSILGLLLSGALLTRIRRRTGNGAIASET